MAGTIAADTLTHSTAGSIATNYVVQGSAKAWFNFNGLGTVALSDSFNMSSVTDNGSGDYTPVMSAALGNANYAVVVGGQIRSNGSSVNVVFQTKGTTHGTPDLKTTTQVRMDGKRSGGVGALDIGTGNGAFHGDLA